MHTLNSAMISVMVNFMCQVNCIIGIFVNINLGDVSVMVFLNNISIWIDELNKADGLSQVGGHHSICWGLNRKKHEKREFWALQVLPK